MTFRFIHTADWQIGKPFGTIAGDAGGELRSQRIRTVAGIAALARDRQVDAVLVAGDAFDSNDVSDKTLILSLEALRDFQGTWVFLPGNHDAALAHSVWTRLRGFDLPPNVVIADEPTVVDRWSGRAVVLPAPLRRRREPYDQTGWFDTAPSAEGACRIGLAHGSVADRLPDRAESGNEIVATRAERAGLSYLALGDWHGALRVADRTYYSGTPEPDRHKDNAAGFVHVVTTNGRSEPECVEAIEIGHFQWVRHAIFLLGEEDVDRLAGVETLDDDPRRCVAALTLTGSVSLEGRRKLDRLLARWDALYHHLEVDDSGLIDNPTSDDLDAIDTAGFVRLAVDRLKLRADDESDPDRDNARLALRLMYLDHRGLA